MRFALVLTILFLSGCATEGGLTKEDQSRQAIRKQAYTAQFAMPDMSTQLQFNDPAAFCRAAWTCGGSNISLHPMNPNKLRCHKLLLQPQLWPLLKQLDSRLLKRRRRSNRNG